MYLTYYFNINFIYNCILSLYVLFTKILQVFLIFFPPGVLKDRYKFYGDTFILHPFVGCLNGNVSDIYAMHTLLIICINKITIKISIHMHACKLTFGSSDSSMDNTAFIKAHNAPGWCFSTLDIFFCVFPGGDSEFYDVHVLDSNWMLAWPRLLLTHWVRPSYTPFVHFT